MTFRMFCAKLMICLAGILAEGITLDVFVDRSPAELRERWERGEGPVEVAREVLLFARMQSAE